MAEPADSWEDMEPAPQSSPKPTPVQKFSFNPNAPSFTFNPSAPSFVPPPATPSFGNPATLPSFAAVIAPAVQPPAPVTAAAASIAPTPELALAGEDVVPGLAELDMGHSEKAEAAAVVVRELGDASVPESLDNNSQVEDQGKVEDDSVEEPLKTAADPVAADVSINGDEGELLEAETSKPPVEEEDSDLRQHLNVVFIGHVDAGKSTIGGQILYLSDMVDERTIQKYEREAKDKNRESWYMAYIMDTNEEERAKGKTVEVGRAHFETEKSRFTILDAPGHKNYVPNMISGASQADVGVLVISARKGEFETGFERGGQTREHAQLAKTLGVSKLLVVVNKMDDPSVMWSKDRFDEIERKMLPFLKGCGYNVKKDVQFLPISGLFGINLKERLAKSVCTWWDGPCLFEALDAVELPTRNPNGPLRMPLIDKFKDMGTVIMGKIESGSVRRGDTLLVMPNKALVKVVTVYRDNDEVVYAKPGENLRIRVSGIEEEDISAGFVLSSVARPIPAVTEFDAQLQILELLDHKVWKLSHHFS